MFHVPQARASEHKQGMHSYLDALDEEFSQEPGYQLHEQEEEIKRGRRSIADPDADWTRHGTRTELGYLIKQAVIVRTG